MVQLVVVVVLLLILQTMVLLLKAKQHQVPGRERVLGEGVTVPLPHQQLTLVIITLILQMGQGDAGHSSEWPGGCRKPLGLGSWTRNWSALRKIRNPVRLGCWANPPARGSRPHWGLFLAAVCWGS